jgi:Protein of unknown function (DUF3108)
MLAAVLFAAPPAPPVPAALPAADQPRLTFAAYAAGFNVLRLAAAVTVAPDLYQVAVSGRTAGAFGALYHGAGTSMANGVWTGDDVLPQHYESAGTWGGDPRRVLIDYSGHDPVVRALDPPDDGYHQPIPTDLQHDAIDTLSAMALLMHRVATTGRCDVAARIFDGRRLSSIAAHTAGAELLPPTGRSPWHGTALRCDFDGRQLAGFPRDQPPDTAGRIQHGSAWLARLSPDGPPVPVRVTFETRFFGAATLYLTGTFTGPTPPAPAQIP